MRYAVVVLVSIAVGAFVYVLTLRAAQTESAAVGFEPEPRRPPPAGDHGSSPAFEPPTADFRYLQVEVDGRTWRDRLQGLVGTIALVALGAAAVAGAIYMAGAAIDRVIRSFLGS
jgi:hypothetical protein